MNALTSGISALPSSAQQRDFPFLPFLIGQAGLIAAWVFLGNILYLPLVILACWVLYLSLVSIIVWLPLVILGYAVIFMQRSEDLTAASAVFAAFLYGILILWLVGHAVVRQEKLAVVSGDAALLLFMTFALGSVLVAVANETKPILWLREFLIFFAYLLYFPLREALRSAKGRRFVYGAFFLLALTIAVQKLISYRSTVALASYAWELLGARQAANEPLFMAVVITSIAVWMTTDNRWRGLMALSVMSFFLLALVLTFSRGYWVGAAIGTAVLFLLGRPQERKRLLGLSITGILAAATISFVLFQDVAQALFGVVFKRLFSATAIDKSLLNRILESEVVWKWITVNPLVGYGLGAEFSYYHILRQSTQTTPYAHNAYLYLWFKFGLFGLACFMTAYLAKIVIGIRFLRTCALTSEHRVFTLASIAILIAMLQVSITSPQFYARDSILIIVLCWAMIAAGVSTHARPGRKIGRAHV